MRDHERRVLRERVDRETATIGASIPESVTIDDETIALAEEVHRLQRANSLDAEDRGAIEGLLVGLRQRRTELVRQLEQDETLDWDAGEGLVDRIIGIDRARSVLRNLDEEIDIESEIQQQTVADMERWRTFIRKASSDVDRGLDR